MVTISEVTRALGLAEVEGWGAVSAVYAILWTDVKSCDADEPCGPKAKVQLVPYRTTSSETTRAVGLACAKGRVAVSVV